MSRPPRVQFPGPYYHVFNRGVEKRSIVLDERDRKTFLQLLGEAVQQFQIQLYAYCLMDNHFHLFLQISLPNLDRAMQSFQSQYAHYFNLRYQRSGVLFQSRYKSPVVQTDSYSLVLTRYIHRNPLEAGLVKKAEDYPWSSYPCYLGVLPVWPWLNAQWLLSQFHENLEISRQFFRIFHQIIPPREESDYIEKMGVFLGSAAAGALAPKAQKGSDPISPFRV